MPQVAATPISGRRPMHRTSRRGRRSFAAYYRWVDDALRHSADGYRLLVSPLVTRRVSNGSSAGAFAAVPFATCAPRGRCFSKLRSGPLKS